MKRNSISIPEFVLLVLLLGYASPILAQTPTLNRDRQSALFQYRKLALADTELSIKLFGVIYANKVIQVGEK